MKKKNDERTHLNDEELVNITGGDEYDDTCDMHKTYEDCMGPDSASFCRWEVKKSKCIVSGYH